MADYAGRGDLIKIRPRAETIQVSRGRTALVFGHDGVIHQDRSVEGLYIYNTRVLGQYEWHLDGKTPDFSCGSNIDQSSWLGYLIQAPENCKETPPEECSPLLQTLELRLTRSVGEGMHEDVHLTNHTQIHTKAVLELQFEIQFVAMGEVKKGRKQHGNLDVKWEQVERNAWELMADYRAEHAYDHQGNNQGTAHFHRGIKLRIDHATSPPTYSINRLRFEVELPPHGEFHACLSWLAYVDGNLLPLSAQCSSVDNSDWDQLRQRFFDSAASFSVPHADDYTALVDRVMRRSRLDLGDLRLYDLDTPDGVAIAAGVPTYQEIFGRDMQIAAWQASMLSPKLLRGALETLGKRKATEINDWRDAQPGRIPHELHRDPLSELNFRPKSLYFGSASASYFFPISVAELWRWTGDLNEARGYVDTAMGAIQWADKYSLDSTGFYRYKMRSKQGVKNQGWKDSGDAIVYPDGSQVEDPIGICEMQGYMYWAKSQFSEIMWRLGNVDVARRLYDEAEDLKKRFNEKFWMEEESYIGFGIDNKGELIRSIVGDPGHCLLTGIVDESRVKQVAGRMMRDDLFSGWGVRTLSSEHAAYNPFAYHRGTVWPVANASFILAFSRYGLHDEMHRLAKATFETAGLFEHCRLPEVFAGHQRGPETPFPGLYSQADWPQAWSASGAFTMLRALLGIHPYAAANVLFVNPHLPEWLPEITVEKLQVGKASVTLRFFRTSDGTTNYDIVDVSGPLRVLHHPNPWSVLSGWAENIRDAVAAITSSSTDKVA